MTPRERTVTSGFLRGLLGFGEVAIVVPIEAAHLVGAVARAGARADAAVIDHLVEAFRRVHRRVHRAAHFARRLLAMHAGHRLEIAARIFGIACVVAVDPQPEHLAPARDLVLADYQHVVLDVAGRNAGVAADAEIEIDHHAPGMFRDSSISLRAVPVGIEGGLVFRRRRVRILAVTSRTKSNPSMR